MDLFSRRVGGWGNCRDNAVVESFFSTLKTELVHRVDFLEVFYNRKRRHSSLGDVSPAEFELAASQVPQAA